MLMLLLDFKKEDLEGKVITPRHQVALTLKTSAGYLLPDTRDGAFPKSFASMHLRKRAQKTFLFSFNISLREVTVATGDCPG